MVPITEAGRLSASHFLDGPKKMQELHARHAGYMKELGLERGREGSRATHQRVKQFYASVDREPELKIEPDRIPDPGRLKVLTAEGARAYKLEVLSHILKQIKEPVRILQDQSQLTRDERAHRVEADKRAAEAERLAQERIEAAEREAQEKIAAVRREEAERFENLRKSALQLLEEAQELQRDKEALGKEYNKLQESMRAMTREKLDFQMQAKAYSDRLTDIPMEEAMQRLGYEGERQGETLVYRTDGGQVAMLIEKQKAFDHQRQLICKNSLDLVAHMRRENEGMKDFDRNHALAWLQDEFGEKRAHGAYLANREQSALEFFGRRNEEREQTRALVREHSADPWRGPRGRAEDHDRSSRNDHDDRGGGGRDFSR
jgi:hypothetical protein